MALCPNGEKTLIRWRYNDEEWNEIEADDYQISTSVGVCPVDYQAFGTYINLNINQGACREIVYWRTKTATNGAEVESWQPVFISPFYVGCPAKNGSYVSIQKISKAQFDSRYMPNLSGVQIFHGKETDNCRQSRGQSFGYDFKLIDIKRVDNLPDDCGDCTFAVFLNEKIVHTEIRDICPKVEHICGERCPSGSCKCEQNGIVCCYNPKTGVCIKSFKI